MNKETRIQKISQIIERDKATPYGKQDILWRNKLESMSAYEIPLECLIYNKYNGRILSRTKTLESQGHIIDVENEDGKKTIENLLWKSKENRNEFTQKDIETKGQLKVGIITKDGIIIDGNRRVMLLNRIKKYDYFRAIVLPVELEDDPIEIEKLETTYQMGEDEKLGYNPIEKYLKAKQLYKKLCEQFDKKESIAKIADWMGEAPSEIENYLGVVDIIDKYLEYLKYDGVYAMADTKNDGKEDLFLYLKKWLDTFRNKDSNKAFDGYLQNDVDDLELICFEYIRAKIGKSYDGKDFRYIADGQKINHFFGDKNIWTSFRDFHFDKITSAGEEVDKENPIDFNSINIEAHLSDRDTKFKDKTIDNLKENIESHRTDLGYRKASNKPLELVKDANKAMQAIDQRHKSFSSPEVLDQIELLNQKTMSMLRHKSPKRLLSQIIHLLEIVEFDNTTDSKEELLEGIKNIEKIAYQMEKKVRKLK